MLERDLDDAANTVREKVAGAMRNVPPEVLPPIIQKHDPDADPIMSIVLSGKSVSLRTLTEIADKQVKRALESVDGVGDVSMSGDRPREIHIVVDIEKLNAHGLSIDQVRDAIQKENVEIPGGTLEQGKWEVGLRTLGRIDATDQFNNIIVSTVNGTPVRISDIGYAEDSTARVLSSLFMADGSPAVQLDIRRASGENTIKVTEAVKQKLNGVRQTLPRGVTLTINTRRFPVHLRVDRVARGAPALGQPARLARRHVLHPEHPRRDHLVAGDSGVDRRDVHADARHGLHAQQHDAARR